MNNHLKRHRISKYFSCFAMGMIILTTIVLRSSMLQMPLERDEGEYAYMGQLLLQGIPPYLNAYSMKLPGLFAIYAIFMGLFGQSIFAIHLCLLIFNAFAVILVYLLTRYLADDVAGIVAALIYALLSVSPTVLGTNAHATQFIVPFVLGGLLLLLKAIDQRKTWMLTASGLLLGFAFLVKQHAFFFVLFAIIYYLSQMVKKHVLRSESVPNMAILIISSAAPFLFVCGLLYLAGVFPKFWFWTFTYASQYASGITTSTALSNFMHSATIVIYPWIFIWGIAAIGLFSIFLNKRIRHHWIFWSGFPVFSFLSICPGLCFRFHYFITLLPAVAMLAGVATSTSMTYISRKFSPYFQAIPVILVIIALGFPAWEQKMFFCASPIDANQMINRGNPFVESLTVAQYIKNRSSETDTVAVLGSEPQIYFYANRKSATGYIYMYGLMEPHIYTLRMQKQMIGEIESAKPRYIVFVNAPFSWLRSSRSDPYILNWAEKYLNDYYLLRDSISNTSDLKIQNTLYIYEKKL
jgi:4-amino-4-deoxy-L-arabinose transferase-like glycosyltransferase